MNVNTGWLCAAALLLVLGAPSAAAHRFRPAGAVAHDPSCSVIVSSTDARDDVSVPCAADVTAEKRGFDAWIETAEAITPFRTFVDPGQDQVYELPLVPAARLSVHTLPTTAMVELWHMESHDWNGARQRSFHRIVRGGAEVMMPEGRILGIFRDADGRPMAVSRPIRGAAGRTVTVAEAAGGDKSALVVVLDRPAGVRPVDDESLAIDAEGREKPDLLLSTANHLAAVWYSLPPGRVRVSLRSNAMLIDTLGAAISGERPVVIRAMARRLPAVEVLVSAPSDLLESVEMSLHVSHSDQGMVRTAAVPRSGFVRLDDLPAGNVEVALLVEGSRIRRQVDLSSGIDAFLTFDLRPITISGVVRYAGDAADAEVAFSAARLVAARTDEGGRYSLRLWQQGRYAVVVRFPGQPKIPPFYDTVRVEESRTLDFEIPAACHSVRVTDAASGKAIPAARVTYANDFDDPHEKRRRVMNSVTAGEDGVTPLPPLRAGSLELWVEATGYNLREHAVRVAKECTDVVIDVALEPAGDTIAVQLLLPDGGAAAGAEVLAIAGDDTVIYSAAADADGIVRVPARSRGALLVVRHPAAGSIARLLGLSDGDEVRWQLPAPGPPLSVVAEDASGRPERNAALFVWMNGTRIGGTALSFASWAGGSSTAADGRWVGRNLPAAPTRVLALRSAAGVLPAIEPYESLAEVVSYPWPSWVKIRVR